MVWNVLEMRPNVFSRHHFPDSNLFSFFVSLDHLVACHLPCHASKSISIFIEQISIGDGSFCLANSSCMLKSHFVCALRQNPLKKAFVSVFSMPPRIALNCKTQMLHSRCKLSKTSQRLGTHLEWEFFGMI